MRKSFFSELLLNIVYQLEVNRERIITLIGFSICIVVIFLQKQETGTSTLPLLLIGALGFALSFRFQLVGNILLFFGGASLIIESLLFSLPYGFVPGGLLMAYAAISNMIKWWKQND